MIAARQFAVEKFRLAVKSCPGGVIMIDSAGTILLVNAETERLFQYRREEFIGRPVEILVPLRYRAELPQYRKSFCDDLHARSIGKCGELFGLRKDGTEIPIEIRLDPIQMPDGCIVILSAINDVSDRIRNDQMKDEFVAMVSHELRTPLTSIAASLGLLVADPTGKLSDNAMPLLRIAHSNSQRLIRLVNDILDIEKIESGNVEFHMKELAVRPLVEQAIEDNRGFTDQFGVVVRFNALSVDVVVRADFDRLTQVMTNLLSNAAKYSPRGGEVLVTIENIGAKVRIAVHDHGPGIPAAFRSRVFERFAQAESLDEGKKGGSGLGLSIVRQIVIKLGGEVRFESAPGKGTIFYVDLPCRNLEYMTSIEHADGTQVMEIA
jgi:PAS domain S-box-containing protein